MLNFLFFFVPLPESLFVFLSDFQDKVSLYNPDSSETCSIAQTDLCLWRVGIKGARHRHPALSFRVAFLPEYITLPLILPSFSQLRLSHFSLFIMLQGWGICARGCSAFQSQSVPVCPGAGVKGHWVVWVLRTQLWFTAKATSSFNCYIISPAPVPHLLFLIHLILWMHGFLMPTYAETNTFGTRVLF